MSAFVSKELPKNGRPRNVGRIRWDGSFPSLIYFGTNGTDPTAATDADGGSLALATAGADNDGNCLRTPEFINYNQANEVWEFFATVKWSDDDQIDSFFVTAVTPASDSAILSGLVDGLGYVKSDGTTAISLQCVKNSTDVGDSDTDYDQAANTVYNLHLRVETGATAGIGNVILSRNGAEIGRLTGVQLPEDELLALIVGAYAGEGAAKTTTVYEIAWNCPDSNHAL